MSSSVEELLLKIGGDSQGGQEALKSLEESLNSAVGAFKNGILEGLGPFGEAAGVALAAATALGTALMELGQHATEAAAELERVSLTTGIAVPALADLQFALDATGGSLDQLNTVMFMFEQRMVNSSTKVADGLKMIGLSLGEIEGMSHDQQLLAISDAMQHTGDDTNKAAAAMDIFGRQGRTILPELMMPLGELAAKSKELGNVTAAAAEKAHEFEIASKTMGAEASRAWTQIGLAVAPVTNELTLGWDRIKLAAANVAVTISDALSHLRDLQQSLLGSKDELPKIASSLKGLADGSGLAAKGVQDAKDRIAEWAGKLPTLDDALENTKESITDLDSETQKHIATVTKQRAAVDTAKAALEGDTRQTKIQIQAINELVGAGIQDEDVKKRVLAKIVELETKGIQLTGTIYRWQEAQKQNLDTTNLSATALDRYRAIVEYTTQTGGTFSDVATAMKDKVFGLGLALPTARFSDWHSVLTGIDDRTGNLASTTIPQATGSLTDFSASIATSDSKMKSFLELFHNAPGDVSLFEVALAGVPQSLERVLAHGGSLTTEISTLGSHIGTNLATNVMHSFQQDAIDNTGEALTGIAGALVKGIPVIGSMVGPAISAIMNMFGPSQAELAGRKVEAAFEQSFGGFKGMMDAVGAAYAATGRSAAAAQADVAALMAAEQQGGAAAQAAADKIKQAFTEQQQDAAALTAAVQRYGFTLAELGPTMQKQELDAQAKQLIDDWRVLVDSGINVVTVDEHMTKSVQDYLDKARLTGQEVPAAMQPIIQTLIEQGDLTDANGNKITDMGQLGITFAETMTQGFDRVVNRLDQLLQRIGLTPGKMYEAAIATQDASAHMVRDLTDVGNAVDRVNFGSSPGGLKEIPILLGRATDALASAQGSFISGFGSIGSYVDGLNGRLMSIPQNIAAAARAALAAGNSATAASLTQAGTQVSSGNAETMLSPDQIHYLAVTAFQNARGRGPTDAELQSMANQVGYTQGTSMSASAYQAALHSLGMASGGVINDAVGWGPTGGPTGTDTVNAWLTPGERVLSVADTRRFESAGGLSGLRTGGLDYAKMPSGGVQHIHININGAAFLDDRMQVQRVAAVLAEEIANTLTLKRARF